MTIDRRAGLALLTTGLLCAVAAPASHAAKVKAVKIKKQYLKPVSVSSPSSVTLKVSVSAPGSKVTGVTAQSQLVGGSQGVSTALTLKGGLYQGVVPIPTNYQIGSTTASIVVTVATNNGSTQAVVGSVSVGATNGLPPPPPSTAK